jgi:hypothetical protein
MIVTKADGEDLTVTRTKIGGDIPITTLMVTTRRSSIDEDDPAISQMVATHKIKDDLMSPMAFPGHPLMNQKVVMDKIGDDPMNRKACQEDGQMNRKITIDRTGVDLMISKVMISKTDDDLMNLRNMINNINLRNMINNINGCPMNQKAMMINKAVDDQMNKMMIMRRRIDKKDEGDVGQVKLVKKNMVGIGWNRTTRIQAKDDDIDIAQGRKERMGLNGENESIVPSLEPGQQKLKNKPITLPAKSPQKAAPMKKEVQAIISVFLTQMD